MSAIEGELNAAVSDFADKLKGLILQAGSTGEHIELNVVSRLAHLGVFLPEYGDRGCGPSYQQLEQQLGEEQVAHGNTLAILAALHGDDPVVRLTRVTNDPSSEGVVADADAAFEPIERADTNAA